MAANDDAEIISINAALAQTSDVTMELNKLLALAPKLQAIPLGGSVIAAEMFTTYTDGGKQNGIIIAALQAQVKRITSNEAAVKTDIGAWTTFLGQVERVSVNSPNPPGSYSQSCNNCSHNCTNISCSCRKINQTYDNTSINYASCPGGSLTNNNGALACGR